MKQIRKKNKLKDCCKILEGQTRKPIKKKQINANLKKITPQKKQRQGKENQTESTNKPLSRQGKKFLI